MLRMWWILCRGHGSLEMHIVLYQRGSWWDGDVPDGIPTSALPPTGIPSSLISLDAWLDPTPGVGLHATPCNNKCARHLPALVGTPLLISLLLNIRINHRLRLLLYVGVRIIILFMFCVPRNWNISTSESRHPCPHCVGSAGMEYIRLLWYYRNIIQGLKGTHFYCTSNKDLILCCYFYDTRRHLDTAEC